LFFLHGDQLDTPQFATDSTERVQWKAAYQPLGAIRPVFLNLAQNLRLSGQYADQETGYYHNGFRTYAADLGRYLESDPIGLKGGINTYAYARSNPVNTVDPSGLSGLTGWGGSWGYSGEAGWGWGGAVNESIGFGSSNGSNFTYYSQVPPTFANPFNGSTVVGAGGSLGPAIHLYWDLKCPKVLQGNPLNITLPGTPITLHMYPGGGTDIEISPGTGASISTYPTNTTVDIQNPQNPQSTPPAGQDTWTNPNPMNAYPPGSASPNGYNQGTGGVFNP
jgi:RHS repeat-associated protein